MLLGNVDCWSLLRTENWELGTENCSLTYSVVIPAYNESNRIRPTLDEILRYVDEHKWDVEILVVDDGSRDDTPEIVREYGRTHPQVQLVQNPGNRGKGFSVRNGMLHARGEICLFTDA